MKLTAKLVTAIVLGIIVLVIIDTFISVNRVVDLFESDMRSDADLVVRLLRPVLEDEWSNSRLDGARRVLHDANREGQALRFRWVWLDAAPDDPLSPHVPPGRLDAVRGGSDLSIIGRGRDGRRYLFTYTPLSLDSRRPAALELAESMAPIDDFAGALRRRAVAFASISAGLGAAVVFSLGFFLVGRPLHAIVEKVRRAGAGDLGEPMAVRGHDELAELARSVNVMCDDLARAMEQLRHADRLATVGTLASGIAHELGTPLNVVAGRAGLIAKGLPPEEVLASTEIIRAQTTRMTKIIRQLLNFARRQAPVTTSVNVYELLQQCTELLSSIARKSMVQVELGSAPGVPTVPADAGQLQQVFANLIMNAMQAMPDGGRIDLRLAAVHAQPPAGHAGREGEYLRIDVEDKGRGISPEDLRHVFDPFFTTKDVGEGTGLGLSIAYGIVEEHGGWINVESQPGEGSCFSVFLPLQRAHPCAAES